MNKEEEHSPEPVTRVNIFLFLQHLSFLLTSLTTLPIGCRSWWSRSEGYGGGNCCGSCGATQTPWRLHVRLPRSPTHSNAHQARFLLYSGEEEEKKRFAYGFIIVQVNTMQSLWSLKKASCFSSSSFLLVFFLLGPCVSWCRWILLVYCSTRWCVQVSWFPRWSRRGTR